MFGLQRCSAPFCTLTHTCSFSVLPTAGPRIVWSPLTSKPLNPGQEATTDVQHGTLYPDFDQEFSFFVSRDHPRRRPQQVQCTCTFATVMVVVVVVLCRCTLSCHERKHTTGIDMTTKHDTYDIARIHARRQVPV